MEVKFEVLKTYVVKLFCDECNTEIEGSYMMLMSDPPQYEYSCPKCKKIIRTRTKYPYVSRELEERSS